MRTRERRFGIEMAEREGAERCGVLGRCLAGRERVDRATAGGTSAIDGESRASKRAETANVVLVDVTAEHDVDALPIEREPAQQLDGAGPDPPAPEAPMRRTSFPGNRATIRGTFMRCNQHSPTGTPSYSIMNTSAACDTPR
jgi:hypothetical protein